MELCQQFVQVLSIHLLLIDSEAEGQLSPPRSGELKGLNILRELLFDRYASLAEIILKLVLNLSDGITEKLLSRHLTQAKVL